MYEGLRDYWHPVALTSEVSDRPIAATLLGEGIVLYRAGNEVVALHDLCIHRGTPLSLGWVDGDNLTCAYHGWSFGSTGACVRIPSLPPGRGVPAKARVIAYKVQERYGLVWVCLGTPREPPPAFPASEDHGFLTFWTRYRLRANAARVIENVMDYAHFPWVHPGILGDRSQPVYESTPVRAEGNELHYTVDDVVTNAVRAYRLTLPFALMMTVRRRTGGEGEGDGERLNILFFVGCPVGEKETTFYFGHARNFARDEPNTVFEQQDNHVIAQDQLFVEGQRPEELPLDLSAELHLRGTDAAAVEYRRALARLGLGR